MREKLILIVVGVIVLFGAAFLLTRGNKESKDSKVGQIDKVSGRLDVGIEPPPFSVKTISGKEISLANLKGQPVVLESYAFWCPSCLLEAANLSEAALPHKDKITIVAFTFDPQETKEETEEFKKATKGFGGAEAFWDFVLLQDGKDIIVNYKMTGPDATYIIGKDGKISYKDRGLTDSETFRREIEKVI